MFLLGIFLGAVLGFMLGADFGKKVVIAANDPEGRGRDKLAQGIILIVKIISGIALVLAIGYVLLLRFCFVPS